MTYLQKLTEARKAIIELIEPYMDKTLSEGCLSYVEGECFFKIKRVTSCGFDVIDEYGGEGHVMLDDYIKNGVIIGHYDITAVDSFIIGIGEELTYRVIVAGTQSKAVLDKNNNFIGNYPNKPLHLYTEKEDKDLLELLKELGPINNN